jgi:hypothetical protein
MGDGIQQRWRRRWESSITSPKRDMHFLDILMQQQETWSEQHYFRAPPCMDKYAFCVRG